VTTLEGGYEILDFSKIILKQIKVLPPIQNACCEMSEST
jgi:hypothetical protein